MLSSAQEEHMEHVDVAIIGAGIAGMQSAFLLTSLGRRTALIEASPWIGGSFHLLDRTFPTDSCGLCFMEAGPAPAFCPTLESARSPLVSLHTLTQVTAVEGEAGDFRLTLRRQPRYVDPARCTACGECLTVCPVSGPSFDEGTLAPRKAIYRPPWRAVPRAFVIDPALCTHCGACAEVCPENAIDLDMPAETVTLHAGAIIAAPGFTPFPAERKGEYGFGVLDNVVTSIQFERMISFSGSTGGRIVRPSDGQPARRLAFISCVGSRDPAVGRPYCSSICCMITAKQAAIARELDPQAACTVFYIDLRAQGRDDEYYLARRLNSPGIRYIRCQVSTIKQSQRTKDVVIAYWDEAGVHQEEAFDLAVLAVGFGPPAEAQELAKALQIALDEAGFARTSPLRPAESSRPGVFAAGAFREPKDIVHSVVEAGAAAALAAVWTPTPAEAGAEENPTMRPGLEDEPPRLGVFLGEVGRPDAGRLGVRGAVSFTKLTLPTVLRV
ncbi:MAG: 4Fe-4S binding protein [Anaerolineae bacterium]